MEALVGGLITLVLVQFSLLWYRMGRIEQRIKELNKNLGRKNDGCGIQGTQD